MAMATPAEWAAKMPDEKLLDYMRESITAALPRAVADEVRFRFEAIRKRLLTISQRLSK